MAVTVDVLEGEKIPQQYKGKHVKVWAVRSNNGPIKYFTNDEEAFAHEKFLQDLELKHALKNKVSPSDTLTFPPK